VKLPCALASDAAASAVGRGVEYVLSMMRKYIVVKVGESQKTKNMESSGSYKFA